MNERDKNAMLLKVFGFNQAKEASTQTHEDEGASQNNADR
jgi:hypothetical protein